MRGNIKTTLGALVLVMVLTGPVIGGPIEEGYAAYENGNYQKAREIWMSIAVRGDPRAQFGLGALIYEDGNGVPQDYAEAANWYRRAANQDHPGSQVALGIMYYKGRGVPQDYAEAAALFLRAAELGEAMGQVRIGSMYFLGHGVPQDYIQAHMWLNLAAAQSYKGAAKIRDNTADHMTPSDISEAQRMARNWSPK